MLYSRPNIAPLGWVLQQTPTKNGSKNYDAMTTDGRPVDFRFSGGWLIVKIGPKGSKNNDYALMETVVEQPIAPFGTMDIGPDQLCDILGITVQEGGLREHHNTRGSRDFDYSGNTIALQQYLYASEAGLLSLLQQIEDSFSNLYILYTDTNYIDTAKKKKKWFFQKPAVSKKISISIRKQLFLREIVPIIDSKINSVFFRICIDPIDGKNFQDWINETSLACETSKFNLDEFFKFTFGLGVSRNTGGKKLIEQSNPEIEIPNLFNIILSKQYQRSDQTTDTYIKKTIDVIDALYFNSVDIINLETNTRRVPKDQWESHWHYFSNDLKTWCSEKPNRYLNSFIYQDDPKTNVLKPHGIKPRSL